MKHRIVVSVALAASLLVASCGSDSDSADPTSPEPTTAVTESTTADTTGVTDPAPETTEAEMEAEGTHYVPDDFPTIQDAVDAAAPGDLILIRPGTYNEQVDVVTENLTIRGLDRNEVILDGNFEFDHGIRVLAAGGVAVENMTAINYLRNGFFWTGVTGFRGSYLTAYRIGDYGVYVFDSQQGVLENIYAAGSPDAGVYIGQCFPCDSLIDNVLSEHNGLGYSGTNSGGNLLIINSVFRNNRAGIVPNSGSYEFCYPERQTTIVGNLVHSNNQPDTPAIDVALLAMGNGILSAGGVQNIIERNRVYDHDKSGIGLVPFLEEDPNDGVPSQDTWDIPCAEASTEVVAPEGAILWNSEQNRVIGNVLEDNRDGDIIVAAVGIDVGSLGNCWADNEFTVSFPADLETLAPCDGTGSGDWSIGAYNILAWLDEEKPPSVDWQTAVLPDLVDQPNMPDAETAPANPALNMPRQVDLASITVPAKPS